MPQQKGKSYNITDNQGEQPEVPPPETTEDEPPLSPPETPPQTSPDEIPDKPRPEEVPQREKIKY